jgi:tetratricopeptide (TPR) repeat protein
MTCTTCHDPHQVQATEHYSAVCRTCHAAAHRTEKLASAGCIDCHMPKRRAEDAVHVVMTDHYIQRRKPDRDLLAPVEERTDSNGGPATLYYPKQLPRTPENELYLALAGIRPLEGAIRQFAPARPEFYFELGETYLKAGKNTEAIRWYEQALRRRPSYAAATKQLVVALFATGQVERAAQELKKSPPDTIILTNLGNAYLRQGKVAQAGRALEQALKLDPEAPEALNLLGLAQLQSGDQKAAETHFREAIRVLPELAAAHDNLANLLTASGDYRQAAYHFEKAIGSDPMDAGAHHRYGLLLVLMRSYDKAARELRDTVRLDPQSAEAHSDLADLLAAQGRSESAREEYARAEQAKRGEKVH